MACGVVARVRSLIRPFLYRHLSIRDRISIIIEFHFIGKVLRGASVLSDYMQDNGRKVDHQWN